MPVSKSSSAPLNTTTPPVKIKTGKESTLVDILSRRHGDYNPLLKLWTLYQAVFIGGDDVKPYLIKHDREHKDAFAARQKRAFYFNYVKQIINLFVAYLYRKGVTRQSNIPEIESFWDNADGSSEGIEHPIDNILKQAAELYLIFGKVAVVVDMPQAMGEVKSEQDRKDQNINPYIYLVKPQNIIDWQYGHDGDLEWIRFEESIPFPAGPLSPRSEGKRWKYTTWTKGSWMIHVIEEGKNGTRVLLDEFTKDEEHGLNRVPVVLIMKDDNFKFGASSGESLIKDIAVSNIALYNLGSITGEEFYNHSLNILVMQRQGGDEDDTEVVLSDKNVLEYDGTQAPHFMAPSSVPVESLQSFMLKIVDEMKRMSRLGSTDSTLTGTGNQTSGLAHAFSFSDSNQALADTAKLFEEIEQRLITLVALWMSMPRDRLSETKVDYPSDFGIDLFDDELATVSQAVDTIPSKTFAKVVKKRTAKKFLSKETPEIVEAINNEIDAAIEALGDQPTGDSTKVLPNPSESVRSNKSNEPSGSEGDKSLSGASGGGVSSGKESSGSEGGKSLSGASGGGVSSGKES